MNLDERAAIERLKADAHDEARRPDGSIVSREASAAFVRLLGEVEGIAPAAIAEYRDGLARKGAAKVLADWRRKHTQPAKTAKGTPVDAPAFAGVRRPDSDGALVHVQASLPGLSLDEMQAHKKKLEAQRNTLSREVRLVSDLIDVMQSEGYETAGEALEHVMRAAS